MWLTGLSKKKASPKTWSTKFIPPRTILSKRDKRRIRTKKCKKNQPKKRPRLNPTKTLRLVTRRMKTTSHFRNADLMVVVAVAEVDSPLDTVMEAVAVVVLAFAALLAPELSATQSAVAALLLASLLLPFSLELEPHVVIVEESLLSAAAATDSPLSSKEP
jgi:hypothetical protein